MGRGTFFLGVMLLVMGAAVGWAASGAAGSAPASAPATRADNSRVHIQNLQALGRAMMIYSTEYNGRIPPTMGLVVDSLSTYSTSSGAPPTGTPIAILTGPDVKMPAEVVNAPAAEKAAWLAKNGGYLILQMGTRLAAIANGSKTPLAIERPEADPAKPQLAVLYFDGHVEQRDRAEVEAMVPKPATATSP